jgi:hypothetical protein
MDQVTQQNAALVEESAAAAESMKEQAQGLIGTVSVFKLAAATQAPAVQAVTVHAAEPAAKPAARPGTGASTGARAALKSATPRGDARPAPALRKVEAQPAANKPALKAKVASAKAGAGDEWEEF